MFFDWCKDQKAWEGEAAVLNQTQEQLKIDGYDLASMGAASIEEWKAAGLTPGHRRRLKKAAKLWLLASGEDLRII